MDTVISAGRSSRSYPVAEWGMAERILPGEAVSGDRYVMRPIPDGVLIAVVDGLGHGAEAGTAAEIAAATLEMHSSEPVIPLLERCHSALKHTRGAAISVASVSATRNSMTWAGVGNVEGVILRGVDETVPAQVRIPLFPGVAAIDYPHSERWSRRSIAMISSPSIPMAFRETFSSAHFSEARQTYSRAAFARNTVKGPMTL